MGMKIWCPVEREEYKLKVSGNKILRILFEPTEVELTGGLRISSND